MDIIVFVLFKQYIYVNIILSRQCHKHHSHQNQVMRTTVQ